MNVRLLGNKGNHSFQVQWFDVGLYLKRISNTPLPKPKKVVCSIQGGGRETKFSFGAVVSVISQLLNCFRPMLLLVAISNYDNALSNHFANKLPN